MSVLFKLSKKSGLHPECQVLKGVEKSENIAAIGGFSEVSTGKIQGSCVAIKVLRLAEDNMERLLKQISNEALIWRQLSHPNVLPFYGIYHEDDNRTRICFISPWMENGTVREYIKQYPSVDRVGLILDIALGLQYLHEMEPSIIHGDLKGDNVLVTPSGHACLADFGWSKAKYSEAFRGSSDSTSSGQITGTMRWKAPELFSPPEGLTSNTQASDMYAFGCVCYEIFANDVPFYEIPKSQEARVIFEVIRGKRPSRPPLSCGLDDEVWKLIENSWNQDPNARPSIRTVAMHLCTKMGLQSDIQCSSDWDTLFVTNLWANLTSHPFCPPIWALFDDDKGMNFCA
ncbi:hypothetical protein PILCRDRAFT_82730 [Piloderma croceum F 1598]|uniref:Protein kinase domain-containing protein n=1 Tax=Piloderma croceum (strain F 1598) TaxID=765440 RepID=A0A0C3B2L1_PILCF|nr:hypothetical protein PILCRDRAFT_82730 [Piloderma croceum F 1598]